MGATSDAGNMETGLVVGVLALQGAFEEHIQLFNKVNVKAVQVRLPEELAAVDALVLPGGESTAISLLARRWGLVSFLFASEKHTK